MITLKKQEKIIERLKSLTEMDLKTVLEELRDHINFNNWGDMVNEVFGTDDAIQEANNLREEIEALENDIEEKNDTLFNIKVIASKADDIEEYEEESFDELKRFINEIKNEL